MKVLNTSAPESLVQFLRTRDAFVRANVVGVNLVASMLRVPAMDVALGILDRNGNDFSAAIWQMERLHAFFGLAEGLFGDDRHIVPVDDDNALRGFVRVAGDLVPALELARAQAADLLLAKSADGLANHQRGASLLRFVWRAIPEVVAELRRYERYRASMKLQDSSGVLYANYLVMVSRSRSISASDVDAGLRNASGADISLAIDALTVASMGSASPASLDFIEMVSQETASSWQYDAMMLLSGNARPLRSDEAPIWREKSLMLLAYWRDRLTSQATERSADSVRH